MQVSIDAYAMFRNLSSNQNQLSGFASALLSTFGLSAPVAGETGTAAAGLQSWGALAAGGYGDGSNDNTDPKAFVNIILFDKNYNFLDVAYAQLKGTEGNYTLLSANYTVKKEGYAYVYISNENTTAVDVYFDDITMTYTPTNVIQYNEYYPFGLQTADSWTRDNASNNFLYNEASELNQTSGFYDLPFRNYDASLGRFFQVDPLSYMDNATSPFAYAGNNPVVFNDPQGLMISSAGLSDYQLRMMYRRDMASYSSYDDWASQNVIEYAGGKGFDAAGGSGGSMWGSWSKTPIFGLVQGRKPRYETEGYDYMELGIVGYEWSYTPGTGGSPFDQVMGDPAVSSAGSPQGNWGGEETQQGGNEQFAEFLQFFYQKQLNQLNATENIRWQIYDARLDRGGAWGGTERRPDGKVVIHISVAAMKDAKLLYHTLGHELIHAADYINGNYDRWYKAVAIRWSDSIEGVMKVLYEYHGYRWDAATEKAFGTNYGAQEEFEFYESQMQDLQLFDLIND